ncbi:hypothetical protein CH375_14175 [Leptospira ellisii]|uniref:Uncharacterized protein n=1 Tax=Leptospira ellisii TaxID=2023197 RepID=A0A2N0BAW3_9LEPT|nr:hypothetical protein CH379_06490 [Leptospira ellisii]PKA03912.1 hypothetical protein CH375_14175 [Leptospira ellisii]
MKNKKETSTNNGTRMNKTAVVGTIGTNRWGRLFASRRPGSYATSRSLRFLRNRVPRRSDPWRVSGPPTYEWSEKTGNNAGNSHTVSVVPQLSRKNEPSWSSDPLPIYNRIPTPKTYGTVRCYEREFPHLPDRTEIPRFF